MNEGLIGLRTIVPYDAVWWGECSGGMDGHAPHSWLSSRINLGAGFAREWNRVSAMDRFAIESMRCLDTVICDVGDDSPDTVNEAFARRHDLYHSMAITRALPGGGLLQFVSLYRHRRSPPFGPVHRVLFGQFSAHLTHRWSARIAALIGDNGVPDEAHGGVEAGGNERSTVICRHAGGRSHKEIAREPGLAPATVRTYLREAHLRLGVSDKVALGRTITNEKRRRQALAKPKNC